MKVKKIFLIIISLIVVIHIALTMVSYYFFRNVNYFKSFYAIYLISHDKETYIEISGYPNWVILGAPEGSVYDKFLCDNGYEEDESQRMGYEHIIIKDKCEESVHFEVSFKYHYSIIYSLK